MSGNYVYILKRVKKLIAHAQLEAQSSTCNRLNVGAVIARDGRIISTGYNGAPSGLPHCGPECAPGGPACGRASHAELNAIAFAARYRLATEGAILVSTDSPCLNCARAVLNAGIKEGYYMREYR